LFHETEQHIFVHANYQAELPLDQQSSDVLLWPSLKDRLPGPHASGKTAIVGHTAQKNGEILDLGYLKCIDTCCYGTGWLTGLELQTGRVWQADKAGKLRDN
jgi:serine/threonine protein phosphatase 1